MADNSKHKTAINIMGIDYQVITDDDSKRVKMIASFVDKLMKETKKSAPYMTNMSASVLSALNLSEELYRLKDEYEAVKEQAESNRALDEYKRRLEEALDEIESNESKLKMLAAKAERLEMENDELSENIEDYKQKYNALRAEYEINKRSLTDLQNKLLENQIELVKARKSLLDINE